MRRDEEINYASQDEGTTEHRCLATYRRDGACGILIPDLLIRFHKFFDFNHISHRLLTS